jgi:hypothetical protein
MVKEIPHKIWKIGDHYIDCGYIPRVVTSIDYEAVLPKNAPPENYHLYCRRLKQSGLTGRSLIDSSIGSCSIRHCGVEWVDKTIAKRWADTGPISKFLKEHIKQFYKGEWGNGREIWWKE